MKEAVIFGRGRNPALAKPGYAGLLFCHDGPCAGYEQMARRHGLYSGVSPRPRGLTMQIANVGSVQLTCPQDPPGIRKPIVKEARTRSVGRRTT
jgi:hypothetical protein